MKPLRLLSAIAIAAAVTLAAAPPSMPPQVGQAAPDFTLVDQDGKRVTLSAVHGQKVVLVFYRGYW